MCFVGTRDFVLGIRQGEIFLFDPMCPSVWLKLRASLYKAQIKLGARLVSANPPPPPVRLVSAKLPPPPPVRLVSAKPPPPCASLAPTPPPCVPR